MATNSQIAFNPQGKTVAVAAAAIAPLGVQAPVNEQFNAQETGQVRVINAGTATVHLGVAKPLHRPAGQGTCVPYSPLLFN